MLVEGKAQTVKEVWMGCSTVRRRRLQISAAMLLTLAIAAIFRLWHIGSTPPGLFGDEAINGLDALDVLAGRGRVFFPGNYGREGLYMFIVAALFKLLNVTPLAIRLSSAIAGILTTLATYWLGRELFRSEMRKGKLTAVPLLAALWLATAYWHVNFSRLGMRGVFTPLFGALTFAAFWRGVNQHQTRLPVEVGTLYERIRPSRWPHWAWFLLSGIFLGLSAHFYSVGRFYPVLLGLFLLAQAIVVWVQKPRGSGQTRGSLLGNLLGPIVGLYAVAATVFAPLGWYFLTHPGSFTQRAGVVFASGSQESPWTLVGQAIVGNVAQFFLPGHGDRTWVYNLPGRAVLEPVTAVLALLGLILCLRRWRRPPYLLLLLWWPAMLLPAFLAVDRIPAAWRVLGVMPALYFFPAIAIGELMDWLKSQSLPARLRQLLVALLLIVPLTVAAVWTARDYSVWAALPGTYTAFEGEAVDAAYWLQANPQPWPVYVSSEFYRHMSFALLYSESPRTDFFSYRDEAIRWFDGRTSLPLPPSTNEATYVLIGNAHTEEEWLDRYLPDRQLLHQSFNATGEPSLSVYRASYRDPRGIRADVSLLEGVSLTGYDIYAEAQPGYPLDVALYWHFAGPQPDIAAGYRVQLALLDDQGHRWATVEEPLDYRPQEWDTGSQAVSWYQIVLPSEAPKAIYRLAVRLTDGEDTAPQDAWAVLAPCERVESALREPLVRFGGALRLLDTGVHVEDVPGGEQAVTELILDTTAPLPRSYTLFLHVLDADDQRVGQRDTATGNGLCPTDAWSPGQPIRDIFRIPVDAAQARQPYRLALGFYDWRTGERLPAIDRDGNRLPDDQFVLEISRSR
jgi:4-amino-4-deoxy-L-arabinose transferase-like glycosyltransferase